VSLNRGPSSVGGLLVVLCALALLASEGAAQTVEARGSTIRFGGRVHAQYAQTSVDDGPPKSLFLRRVRFTADVIVNEYLDGRIMPDFAGGTTTLQDAYVRLKVTPWLRISVGQLKRAFDLFALESTTQLPLVERDGGIPGLTACEGVGGTCSYTRLAEALQFAGRDVGVRFDGALGQGVSYQITVTNGEGSNVADVNQGKSGSGRVAFETGASTEVAFNVAVHDVFDEEVAETTYSRAYGVDAKVGDYYDGPMLMASLIRGANWKAEGPSGRSPSFWTGQVTGTYHSTTASEIVRAIEPVLRLSYANPNTDATDVSGFLVTPGVHFYFEGRNRIGINVDVFSPSAGDTEYSWKLMTYLYF